MKMKALLASGLCLALSFPLLAQVRTKWQDSVYITPFAGCKLLLVGGDVRKILKENNLEILKNKFIADYQESTKDKDFPAGAKSIIYLAGQNGKRRLKVVPDETAPLKIEDEIKAFNEDLPAYHYIIYDLIKDFEYHIYVKDPEDLNKLSTLDCSELIAASLKQSSNGKQVSLRGNMEIVRADSGYTVRKIKRNNSGLIALSASAGICVINSSLATASGIDLDYYIVNKYGQPKTKVGLNFTSNILARYENKNFTDFSQLNHLNVHYLVNVSRNTKEYWLGLTGGFYLPGKSSGGLGGALNRAWQFGPMSQFGSFGIELNYIRDRHKNPNTALTIRYYF